MRATMKRTLLFGSKLGTILVVMALGIGIGLGFSTLAHPPQAGNQEVHHACINDTTGQVLMPAAMQSPSDTACPAGWTAAHWPERIIASASLGVVFAVPAVGAVTQDISCGDPNDRVISAGVSAELVANAGALTMRQSFPLDQDTWRLTVESATGAGLNAIAHILCVPDS